MNSTASGPRGDFALRLAAAVLVGALALAAAGAATGLLEPARLAGSLPDLCAYHRLTGHHCPGCGMGRSLAELASGEPGAAFAAHPFGPVLAASALLLLVAPLAPLAWRRRLVVPGASASLVARAAAAAVVAWWLLARVLPAA